MSRILKEQMRMIRVKLQTVDDAIFTKDYATAIQALHECGVMMLAVGVAIQKFQTRGE